MSRLSPEELKRVIEQEGCDRLWSWSRINCFRTSPYEYFLRYVKGVKEDRQDCIYGAVGGMCHEILEKLYTNKIKHEDMAESFEDIWTVAYDISKLKFDRNDEEKNEKIGSKYYENLKHFFSNHSMLKHKPAIEKFVKIRIGEDVFQGYIDCCFKDDDGNFNIVDFKTSTIYKGSKAENECGQLVLYAIALNQMGVPMENIRIGWNFLKYCTVQYQQKNGAIKTKEVERHKIGENLQSNAGMWLREFGYNTDEYLMELLESNDIDVLPDEVKEKYILSDCYVYVPLTQKLIDRWIETVTTTIMDIRMRETDYNKTQSEMYFYDTDESVEKNSYYFATLCGYSPNLHKPYQQHLSKLEAKKNGNDLFSGVGSSVSVNNGKSKDEVDLSWLNDIT